MWGQDSGPHGQLGPGIFTEQLPNWARLGVAGQLSVGVYIVSLTSE